MIIRYFEPTTPARYAQDPLPRDWRERDSSGFPPNFSGVVEGRLYRSGLVLPEHVERLHNVLKIDDFIVLLEGNWLDEFSDREDITIHQFPTIRRSDLTKEHVQEAVRIIDSSNRIHVSCNKGITRTGEVIAAHRIAHGSNRLLAAYESLLEGNLNISSIFEILSY
jgi:hypothetical protein